MGAEKKIWVNSPGGGSRIPVTVYENDSTEDILRRLGRESSHDLFFDASNHLDRDQNLYNVVEEGNELQISPSQDVGDPFFASLLKGWFGSNQLKSKTIWVTIYDKPVNKQTQPTLQLERRPLWQQWGWRVDHNCKERFSGNYSTKKSVYWGAIDVKGEGYFYPMISGLPSFLESSPKRHCFQRVGDSEWYSIHLTGVAPKSLEECILGVNGVLTRLGG